MRLHRFIGPYDLSQKQVVVTDPAVIAQWRTVLRLRSADTVILCDGNGNEAEATLLTIEPKQAVLAVTMRTFTTRKPAKKVTLYLSLLRRENFELSVQKATEIGVTEIVPIVSIRTVKTGYNRTRLEKIILEASEQCGRTTLPVLKEAITLPEAFLSRTGESTVFFDPQGDNLLDSFFKVGSIDIFIGPEGGFTEQEVSLAKDHGCTIKSLGTMILRAETAAIAATFLACREG
jgi:16S rRNA (uracil1498-N3)-methyltransferase